MSTSSTTPRDPLSPAESPGPITEWVHRFDEESVSELMRYYRPLLRAIVARNWDQQYQQRLDPSDAVQLTWGSIAVQAKSGKFKDRKHFVAYLIQTLHSQLIDIRRLLFAEKRRVTKEVSLSTVQIGDALEGETEEPSALDRLIHQELAHDVLLSILRLPRELQRLIRWKFRKGMTYKQIADKIGRNDREVRLLVIKCVREITYDVRRKHPMSR